MKKIAIPFAVMLVALSAVTQAAAGTVCVSGYVCDDRPPAPEFIQPPTQIPVFEPSPIVLLPFQDSTGWNYGFAAPTQTKSIVMPHFADSAIFEVGVPDGWTYAVGAQGVDGKTTATWQQITASSTPIGIFSFKSIYSPSEATYLFTFDDGSTRNYQLFVPFSPLAQASGYAIFAASVPEPSAIYMAALGFVACAAATRRRKMAN